jgi:hypothetical protein
MRYFSILTVMAATVMFSAPLSALESYPAEIGNQFLSWCSRTQEQPQTVCSCALNKAALEIPASAMASFLSASEGTSMVFMSQGVGATTVQIVATCATAGGSTGSTGGTMLKSLGSSLGQ